MNNVRSILVCSAAILTPEGYVSNVGDEALTAALVAALRDRFPRTRVFSTLNLAGNARTKLPPNRVPVRPIRELAAAIRAADVVVVGGGTLLQEDVYAQAAMPVAGLLRYVGAVVALSNVLRKPVVFAGVGAENIVTRRARAATRIIARRATAMTTRDVSSADLIAEIAGTRPTVAADTMFLHRPRTSLVRDRICVNLRRDASTSLQDRLAASLRPYLDASEVVLVPMDRRFGEDGEALRAFAERLGRDVRCRMLGREDPWESVLAEIGSASLAVGMRLHFQIFAAIAETPVVALTSSPKTRSFVADLGIEPIPVDADEDTLARAIETAQPPTPARVRALEARAATILETIQAVAA